MPPFLKSFIAAASFAAALTANCAASAPSARIPDSIGFTIAGTDFALRAVSAAAQRVDLTRSMLRTEDAGKTELHTPFGIFNWSEVRETLQSGKTRFQYRAAVPDSGSPIQLEISALLPAARTADSPPYFDGQRLTFPREASELEYQHLLRNVREVLLPVADGTLVFTGNFNVCFQDNRKWNQDAWELRLGVEADSFEFQVFFEPYRDVPVPLAEAANMGFLDEVADDGRGGWTDQGPDNDLRMFPVGTQIFNHVRFEIVDPAKNQGKSCLAMAGPERSYFLNEAIVVPAQPVAARYLHLLSGVAWPKIDDAGTVTIEYDVADVPPTVQTIRTGIHTANFWSCAWLPEGVIGWQGKNFHTDIALYQCAIPLRNVPVKRITFTASGKQVWLIAGLSLSTRPLEGIDADRNTIADDGVKWKQLRSTIDLVPGGILDFFRPEEAPAGKYGFLRNVGDHFEFENRPGEAVRFYGANLCFFGAFMDRNDADRMAEHMARSGYNAVRLHHFDELLTLNQAKSTDLDPARLDELDYLVAALKKRGIYITLDFFTLRPVPKTELRNVEPETIREDIKLLTYVNDSVRDNMYSFAANLMNHVNPYTGLAWKDDPAIAHISLLNENTLFDLLNLFPESRRQYEEAFRKSPAGQKTYAAAEEEALARRVFYSELFKKGFRDFRAYLRGLGVRVPVTDFNCGNTGLIYPIRETFDYVDNHFYFDHPVFLGANWNLPYQISNRSSMPTLVEPLPETASSRIFGKPFTVTEWNFCFPNSYAVEGAFLTGAYAALQDWSGLYRFVYNDKKENIAGAGAFELTMFNVIDDPVRMLSERAGVCFFRRGDVRIAPVAFPAAISRNLASLPDQDFRMPDAARLGVFFGRVGAVIDGDGDGDGGKLPPGSATILPLDSGSTARQWPVPVLNPALTGRDFLSELARKSGQPETLLQRDPFRLTSVTGEISLEPDNVKFTVTTPNSEGVLLNGETGAELPFLRIANRDGFAAFLAAAVDGRTLRESERILLLHLTESKNSEMEFSDSRRQVVNRLGKVPVLIRRGNADVTLKRSLEGFRLYAVDLSGKRIFEIPLKKVPEGAAFHADTFAENSVTLAYELVREEKTDVSSDIGTPNLPQP